MKLLEHIKEHGLIPTCDKFKLISRVHNKYPNLTLLKYNQLESDFSHEETRQARGIILDMGYTDGPRVVSRSFDKFFNAEEFCHAQIDWDTARVQEKLDGSLTVLYWYDGKWNVQTSGSPDASGEVNTFGFTFEKLFWDTWNKLEYKLPTHTHLNYIFELCTPFNKIIVQHKESRLVWLGARKPETGQEYRPSNSLLRIEERAVNTWESVKTLSLNSMEEILEAVNKLNPLEQEGYVVCDEDFNRIKVKSISYVALHHMKDGFGPRRILEIIRTGETEEFLTYFPEFADMYHKYKLLYDQLVFDLENLYKEYKDIPNQKDFALKIAHFHFSGALFMLRAGKIKSVREFLSTTNIQNLIDYFGDNKDEKVCLSSCT